MKRAQLRACPEYYAASYRNRHSTTWKDIRKFLLASKKPEPRVNAAVRDPAWAERLNTHFVRMGAECRCHQCAVGGRPGEPLQPRPPRVVTDSFRVRTVTLPELSHALRSMNNSKACSDDGITVDMLRRTFAVIGPHLLHVCSQ